MIKPKVARCRDCQKETNVIAGRCITCYWRHRAAVNSEKNGKSHIDKRSAKKLERDIEYAKLSKAWKKEHPICEAQLSGCTHASTQVHHRQGREGALLTDVSKWLAVCHQCHIWITEHSREAIELGLSLKRNI